jgi:hypothetical protein
VLSQEIELEPSISLAYVTQARPSVRDEGPTRDAGSPRGETRTKKTVITRDAAIDLRVPVVVTTKWANNQPADQSFSLRVGRGSALSTVRMTAGAQRERP